jgi:hypothetical protein
VSPDYKSATFKLHKADRFPIYFHFGLNRTWIDPLVRAHFMTEKWQQEVWNTSICDRSQLTWEGGGWNYCIAWTTALRFVPCVPILCQVCGGRPVINFIINYSSQQQRTSNRASRIWSLTMRPLKLPKPFNVSAVKQEAIIILGETLKWESIWYMTPYSLVDYSVLWICVLPPSSGHKYEVRGFSDIADDIPVSTVSHPRW